jgi:hypothetical protein
VKFACIIYFIDTGLTLAILSYFVLIFVIYLK